MIAVGSFLFLLAILAVMAGSYYAPAYVNDGIINSPTPGSFY